MIDRNARAQVRLIEDLLDLSRIMAGKVRLDVQQVSLVEIVQSVIESAEPGAKAKDIRLEARLDPDTPLVPGDSDRLQQVVWNLLSNAIKFTAKGGRVEVVLQRAGANTVLSVSDTGIGIPETFLPRVFDRFSQNDASTTRSFGGLGLGLAISKQLVELHGGTIRASSPGEGRGATFFVELPLAARCRRAATQRRQRRRSPLRRPRETRRCPGSTACTSSSSTTRPTGASCCAACSRIRRRPSRRCRRARRRSANCGGSSRTSSSATSACR